MTAQAISALGPTVPSLYTTKANDSMDKSDFLHLLITQLQQQDPLNPQDPTQFTAQLTQFSSLEQMMTMNQSIQSLQALQMSSNNALAASFIGKDISYTGDTLTIKSGANAPAISFTSDMALKNGTVTITNAAGKVVRTIQVPSVATGDNTIAWDGKGNDGTALPAGTYTITAVGTDATGKAATMQAVQTGHVTGIVFKNGQTMVDVEGVEIPISSVLGIHEAKAA